MTQPRRIISVAVFVAALLLLPRFPVGLLGILICEPVFSFFPNHKLRNDALRQTESTREVQVSLLDFLWDGRTAAYLASWAR